MNYFYEYKSPIGIILIGVSKSEKYITHTLYADKTSGYEIIKNLPHVVKFTIEELRQYFNGQLKVFSVPIFFDGTDFQKSVWKETMKIKYGKTRTYKDVAGSVGREEASRSVGRAEGSNKINIIIPCHRVISRSGSLAGYGGGIERKEYLLNLEKKYAQ